MSPICHVVLLADLVALLFLAMNFVTAAISCNFVNASTIAYRVHVYMRASLIHSPNPNADSSSRIAPTVAIRSPCCGASCELANR